MRYHWMLASTPHYGRRVLDPLPRLVLFAATPPATEAHLLALGELLEPYSARIERAGDAGYYLDISASPAVDLLVAQLQHRAAHELGLPLAVGLSPNKIGARVAAAQAAPGQVRRVALADVAALLAPLPVRLLPGLLPEDVRLLAELGVSAIGQIASVPITLLTVLFGLRAGELHRLANGCDLRPVGATLQAAPLEIAARFVPTLDRQQLDATLRRLVADLCARLRRAGRAAREVSLSVEFNGGSTTTKQRRLAESVDADQLLSQVAESLLIAALQTRRQRARSLVLRVARLTSPVVQLSLFVPSAEVLRFQRLNLGLDAIREQFGAGAIQPADVWARGYAGAIVTWADRAQRPVIPPPNVVRLLGWSAAEHTGPPLWIPNDE